MRVIITIRYIQDSSKISNGDYIQVLEFLNKRCINIERGISNSYGNNECLRFSFEDGSIYEMTHQQDCCEHVSIESINGDFSDLIGQIIILAEERSDSGNDGEYGDSYTWTFYSFATIKGYVDIRWLGSSNGYYSERVDIIKVS